MNADPSAVLATTCRRLFLRNYEVSINIGVHAFEKTGEQRVLFNVDLYIPLAQSTPQADELDEVVDYDFIRSAISERCRADTSTCKKPFATTYCGPCWPIPRYRPPGCQRPSPMCTPTARPSAAKCSA